MVAGLRLTSSNGLVHSCVIFAKSEETVLGGPDDQGVVTVKWFRTGGEGGSGGRTGVGGGACGGDVSAVCAGGDFELLEGVTGGFYQPSVDDVGCRIIVECAAVAGRGANSRMCDHGCV